MDYFFRLLVLFSFPGIASAAFTSAWVDGPAPATFVRNGSTMEVYIDMPAQGGHAVHTLESSAPSGGLGKSVGAASTATTPKISSNIKIPIGSGVGSSIKSKITASISKSALAKTGLGLIRLHPGAALALNLAWLAQAGIEYFSDSDEFKKAAASTTSSCPYPSFSGQLYNASRHELYTVGHAVSGWDCPSTPGNSIGVCNGYMINGVLTGTCVNSSVGVAPTQTITATQAESDLAAAPVTSSGDTASGFDGLIKEDYSNGANPPLDGNSPIVTGIDAGDVAGPSSTSTAPDGTVTNTNTSYHPTYNNDNSVHITENKTTVVTYPDNHTETTTTSSTPETNVEQTQQTDCDKYPNSVGCSELGDVPAAELLTTQDVPLSLSPSSWGSGTCPVPKQWNLNLSPGQTFDYQPTCDFLTYLKPILLAIGWMIAGYTVLGGLKD